LASPPVAMSRIGPTNWSSPYQAMLACKIALVAAMVCLAIVNRYVFVPPMTRDIAQAVQAIRRAIFVEIALGLGVVALVSLFGMLEPT
jgi:copper resistance protein D